MAKHNLDSLDRKILKLIAADARIPCLEVARACNVSGAAIHQRLAKLQTCAYVLLYLKNPEDHDKVVEKLKKIPEVIECHATTGAMDLFIKMYARNNHNLMEIIHDRLQPLGLSRSETIISFSTDIDRQLPILDDFEEEEYDLDDDEDED